MAGHKKTPSAKRRYRRKRPCRAATSSPSSSEGSPEPPFRYNLRPTSVLRRPQALGSLSECSTFRSRREGTFSGTQSDPTTSTTARSKSTPRKSKGKRSGGGIGRNLMSRAGFGAVGGVGIRGKLRELAKELRKKVNEVVLDYCTRLEEIQDGEEEEEEEATTPPVLERMVELNVDPVQIPRDEELEDSAEGLQDIPRSPFAADTPGPNAPNTPEDSDDDNDDTLQAPNTPESPDFADIPDYADIPDDADFADIPDFADFPDTPDPANSPEGPNTRYAEAPDAPDTPDPIAPYDADTSDSISVNGPYDAEKKPGVPIDDIIYEELRSADEEEEDSFPLMTKESLEALLNSLTPLDTFQEVPAEVPEIKEEEPKPCSSRSLGRSTERSREVKVESVCMMPNVLQSLFASNRNKMQVSIELLQHRPSGAILHLKRESPPPPSDTSEVLILSPPPSPPPPPPPECIHID